METNNKLIEILNDLIKINNDRVAGYEKAGDETKAIDIDLQGIFYKMAEESKRHSTELQQEVKRLGGEPTNGTTTLGKIYRIWMDVKTTFSGKDRHAVLEDCEFGEDAAQKAYTAALGSPDTKRNALTFQLLKAQQNELKIGHNLIKKYRDLNKAAV
jgi:uncharacterized protein (TIGR02284 family)